MPLYTVACELPDGVESDEKAVEPLYCRVLPLAVKTVPLLTEDEQVKAPEEMAQRPLDDFKVNPLPDAAAVKVAQVPLVYQVPPEMMQPFWLPPETTLRVPEPLKELPVAVALALLVVVVLVAVAVPEDFGRY